MWTLSGWGVAFFLFGMMATNAIMDHAKSFDPLFCSLYSSSPSKSSGWWENLEGVACVEDRRKGPITPTGGSYEALVPEVSRP